MAGAQEIETAGANAAPPAGAPLEEWPVAAVGPDWRPRPGVPALAPAGGRLQLYADALVFRADDALDARTGAPLVAVIPAAAVTGAAPLSPGSRLTASEPAGRWMRPLLRRFRSPGFVVSTAAGAWAFECPQGQRRALAVSRRYGSGP